MAYVETKCLGPPHHIAHVNLVSNWNPTTSTATLTVNCTGLVPANTIAVEGDFYFQSTTAGNELEIREYGTANEYGGQGAAVANQHIHGWYKVMLDSSLRFDVYSSDPKISGVYVEAYYLYFG